jgi:DNA-binding GntR family transcriptional regulator
VREAVQRLAQEGFCQILPRRGLLINPIDYAHQLDVVGVRLILEPAAAALAAERIAPLEAERLKQLLKSLEKESSVKRKTAQPTTADEELHREVAEIVRNDVLTSTLLPLYAHSRRLWVHEHRRGLKEPSAIVEEWTRIVDGVTSGDAQAAFDGMKDHVVAARTAILHGDRR